MLKTTKELLEEIYNEELKKITLLDIEIEVISGTIISIIKVEEEQYRFNLEKVKAKKQIEIAGRKQLLSVIESKINASLIVKK